MKSILKTTTTLLLFVLLFLNTNTNAQNCPKYIDAKDSTKTFSTYSIYREYFKKNLFVEALPAWREIFTKAPGLRAQTFMDGEVIFTNLIQNTTDKVLKEKYIDTLFMVYDKRVQCHGQQDFILGKKAVDQLKYRSDIAGARQNLEKSLQLSGNNAYPFVIQTYFKLLNNQLNKDAITTKDFVKTKYDELTKLLDLNIAKPDNKQLQSYKDVKTVLDDLYTQNFADKSDPTDCAKLVEMYKKKYNENPNDVENLKLVYNKTKGCTDSLFNTELLIKLNQMAPSYTYAKRLGNIYLKNNNYEKAIPLFENAANVEKDSLVKADIYFTLANIKYEKNEFPASRDYAKLAIANNPKMSNAYLLIGTLYAASGKLCGPGTGFKSQIVLWPAFDYWKKAIEIDGSADAKNMINTYKKYLPTTADLLKNKLKVGSPYKVACWINENTTAKIK